MSQSLIEKWIREDIRTMSAYHVADAAGFVKLDAMENPFDWPAELKQQWHEQLAELPLNRYPDPEASGLVKALRENMSISEDFDLLLGNGSDEIIQMLCMAVAGKGRVVMAPDPSFVMYKIIAGYFSLEFCPVTLNPDFSLDLDAMLNAIHKHQPALIFLAQPNNPTGNLFQEEKVRAIIEAAEGFVIVDEAYTAFTENNSLPLLQEYPNVLLMRTLSKVGLAGLRLGLLIASPVVVEQLNKTRLPYNINVLTQFTAKFALQNYHVFEQQTETLCSEREKLSAALSAIEGVEVFPSEANFLLVRFGGVDANEIFLSLKEQGVLVKNLGAAHSLLSSCLRLTVGSPEENNVMFEAIKKALA